MLRTALALLLLTPLAPATDYYVSAHRGSDTNPGNIILPFKTLTFALGVAKNGDRVLVFPGRYSPTLGETFPLKVLAGVKVLGTDARSCVIDAEYDPTQASNPVNGTVVELQADTELAHMSVVNAPRDPGNPGNKWWNVLVMVTDATGNADNVHIHHCNFDEFSRGVVVGFATGNHSHKNVLIDNCVFSRFYVEAINSWVGSGTATGNRIVNCTIVGHLNPTNNKPFGRACISFGPNAQFDVRNCVLKDADWAGLESSAAGVTSDYNCYHGNSGAVRGTVALGNNDIQFDPQLAALPTVTTPLDAHQSGPGGPLFEKGTNIITTGSDMDYESRRLSGGFVDIGADEFNGPDVWFVGVPRLGTTNQLGAVGTPNDVVFLGVALSLMPPVTIPGFTGTLVIDLSRGAFVLPLPTDSRGLFRQNLTVPNDSVLLNLKVFIQGLARSNATLSDLDAASFVR